MTRSLLPIGIQSFEKIRREGYVYVDKTRFILDLVQRGTYYFLSRPRRFGKSLFVDTLDCAFSGKAELFAGLTLTDPSVMWNFSNISPILRLDFSGGTIRSPDDLNGRLHRIIDFWEERYRVKRTEGSPGERLVYLVPQIAEVTGKQVVILVDEYDKPILDNLDCPVRAGELRDLLRDFYSAIKPLDVHLRFVFLTGVLKFSKTGIFSGLNNLKDITLDRRYSAICGYTEADLREVFGSWMMEHDADLVANWYNGYSWAGEPVYNPFDILLFLDEGIIRPYWFETGTPSFLVKILTEHPRSLPDLDTLLAGEDLLGSFRIEDIKPETLLFQSGYLTIKRVQYIGEKVFYRLGFPNLEVKSAFSSLMLDVLTKSSGISTIQRNLDFALDTGDTATLREVIYSFFASIPYDWYRKNQLSGYEEYYASIVYAYFASLGYQVIAEDTTNRGRIDLTVFTKKRIWIFEFKVLTPGMNEGNNPLAQIQEKRYAEKYKADGRPVIEVGIVFDPETRNIIQWEAGI